MSSLVMTNFTYGQQISVKHIRKDIKFYFSTIKKTHPSPYYYASSKTIDSVENQMLKDINKPLFSSELARKIEFETNPLFDNHTKIHHIFHNPIAHYYGTEIFFPWDLKIIDENLYLLDEKGQMRIVSINKYNATDILRDMKKIFSADISDANKNQQIETNFPLYYYLTCLERGAFTLERKTFSVEVEHPANSIETITAQGKTEEEVKAEIAKKNSYNKYDEPFQFELVDDSIALLTVNTFETLEGSVYADFLENSFKQISQSNCRYLFIDIKNNGGGSSMNALFLLDYVYKDDYNIFGSVSTKRVSKAYTKEYGREPLGEQIHYNGQGKYVQYYDFFARQKEVLYPFEGTVFLLQSYQTASSALDMSAAIKSSRRGIVIGNPTGEPATSFSQGVVFQLPYSKLYFQCAIGLFVMSSGSSDDKWIQPDIYKDITKMELNQINLKEMIKEARLNYLGFFKE
jgi:hypothetical protein